MVKSCYRLSSLISTLKDSKSQDKNLTVDSDKTSPKLITERNIKNSTNELNQTSSERFLQYSSTKALNNNEVKLTSEVKCQGDKTLQVLKSINELIPDNNNPANTPIPSRTFLSTLRPALFSEQHRPNQDISTHSNSSSTCTNNEAKITIATSPSLSLDANPPDNYALVPAMGYNGLYEDEDRHAVIIDVDKLPGFRTLLRGSR